MGLNFFGIVIEPKDESGEYMIEVLVKSSLYRKQTA